jgi:hypothetical protein
MQSRVKLCINMAKIFLSGKIGKVCKVMKIGNGLGSRAKIDKTTEINHFLCLVAWDYVSNLE